MSSTPTKSPKLGKQLKPAKKSKRLRCLKHLKSIENYLNAMVLERESETRGVLLALLSGKSCFFLGDAGAGKTHHIEKAAEVFSLILFDTLMSKTTKPDSIFGPVDVPALAKGVQQIKTKGYAPEAELLFLDEIFKANDVVLNPLLWLLNEHKFRNGDHVQKCPTIACFAASNEIPTEKELRPLYDRFLMRFNVEYLQTEKSVSKLFAGALGAFANIEKPKPFARKDLDYMRGLVNQVVVPQTIQSLMVKCRNSVESGTSVVISDRRMAQSLVVVQAHALLEGRKTATASDLIVLTSIFWDAPEQQRKVAALVLGNIETSGGELHAVEQAAESVFDTAIKNGKLRAGRSKLKRIVESLPTDNIAANQVRRRVESMVQTLSNTLTDRTTFKILVLLNSRSKEWFRISTPTQSLWTPQQLRDCGFKQKRGEGYWWADANKGNTRKALSKKVEKVTKVLPVFEEVM